MSMRIGQGFDVHAFGPGDHVMLGGVRIEHDQGLRAHSDGDVVLHALCDALLGACAKGDIGQHFSPGDPQWRDADSRDLLGQVLAMIHQAGFSVVNLDLTVICEMPRISPHVQLIRQTIAEDLKLDLDAVSVKATTTEGLGFCGRGEGIAAQAIVLLTQADGAG